MSDTIILFILHSKEVISDNKLYLSIILVGALLILTGIYISIYRNSFTNESKKINLISNMRLFKFLERITNVFPLKILSFKIKQSISYFMAEEITQRRVISLLTLILPISGILLYFIIGTGLKLWYTRLITLALCIMLPYYIFTLAADYRKYSMRLKIPELVDSFRCSFTMHYRIKPALQECSINNDKVLNRMIHRAADSSDLNKSLFAIRNKINDTWFNIFVLLLVNYRENGGELIAQLYKLNRSITRYNNIEKKKSKRLIWYEIFTILVSVFSLPAILLLNRILLGINAGLHYDTMSTFSKVVIYSLASLIVVRILRKM